MIHQISELKVMVQEREDDLLRARKQKEALGKDLERARDDIRHKDCRIIYMFIPIIYLLFKKKRTFFYSYILITYLLKDIIPI